MRTSSSSTSRKRKNLSPLASVDLEPCGNYDLHRDHLEPSSTSKLLLLPQRRKIDPYEPTESSRDSAATTETINLFGRTDNKILGNLEIFRDDFQSFVLGREVVSPRAFYEILQSPEICEDELAGSRTDDKIHQSYEIFWSDLEEACAFTETRTIDSSVVGRDCDCQNLPESFGDDIEGHEESSDSQVSALFRACESRTSVAVLCILRDDCEPVDQAVRHNRLADCGGHEVPIDIQSETTTTRIPYSLRVANDIAAQFVENEKSLDSAEFRGSRFDEIHGRGDLLELFFFREGKLGKGTSRASGLPSGEEKDLSKRQEMFRKVPEKPTANLTDPVFNFRQVRLCPEHCSEIPQVLPIDYASYVDKATARRFRTKNIHGEAFSHVPCAQKGRYQKTERKAGYRLFEKYRRFTGDKKYRVLASGKRHSERNRPVEVESTSTISILDEGYPAKLDDRKYKLDVSISPQEQSQEQIDKESPQKITFRNPRNSLQKENDRNLCTKPDELEEKARIVSTNSHCEQVIERGAFTKFEETQVQDEFFQEERSFTDVGKSYKKRRIGKEDSHLEKRSSQSDHELEKSRESGEFKKCVGRKRLFRLGIPTRMVLLALLWVQCWSCAAAVALASGQKYSMRVIKTRYGTLRGVVQRSSTAVETYYGVPYATPPLGALRYMPPVTPTPWRGTRFADTMPPACPQRSPQPEPPLPRNSRAYLQRISPLLANQSEDCLYLNLYVPQPTIGNASALLPALLLIHGDSYAWGSGNSLDGTALAAHGRVIVVSINFRLGVLGFLKTGPKNSAQGNYGLMDLVAGLHWLRENLKAFGGDPERLVLLGHGTGAALANFLAVSPMAKELVKRVVLLGGSALSPWAVQRDPLMVKRRVAEHIGCSGDMETDDIAQCLRLRSIEELLDVELDPPRFTSGFAPFVDGTVLPQPINQNFQPTASSAGIIPLVPGPGAEFANFGDRNLMLGLTSDEAWISLTDEDMQNGLNETRRDRILRTYVRNTYRYHLHEIYSTLRNEYTDWERGEQSPYAICEGLLSLLGDGQVAAPLLRLALLHSTSGGHDYFLHFQPGDRSSRRGEELPYLLGLPLLRAEAPAYGLAGNYTAADENLSRLLVHYLANYVRRGDPNGASPLNSGSSENGLTSSPPFWDRYDSLNQLYLEVGRTTEMRSHYRGHKMSLWLNLLPQLHRPGYEISMRHHHLSESPSLYEGPVRPQTMAMPLPAPPLPMPSPTVPSTIPSSVATTECTPNATATTTLPTTSKTMQNSNLGPGPNNLLRKLASSHYQSYTTALTVTIAVGVFLLLLNILIFAGIYHQRDRNNATSGNGLSSAFGDKKKEELLEAGCSGIKAVSSKQRLSALNLMESPPSSPPPHKAKLVQELELQLQDFQCSPPPGGGKRVVEPPSYSRSPCLQRTRTPSPCVDATTARMDEDDDNSDSDDDNEEIPEPPPPPKVPAPNVALACPGILRQPGTPGSAKKRVQIQEISV